MNQIDSLFNLQDIVYKIEKYFFNNAMWFASSTMASNGSKNFYIEKNIKKDTHFIPFLNLIQKTCSTIHNRGLDVEKNKNLITAIQEIHWMDYKTESENDIRPVIHYDFYNSCMTDALEFYSKNKNVLSNKKKSIEFEDIFLVPMQKTCVLIC